MQQSTFFSVERVNAWLRGLLLLALHSASVVAIMAQINLSSAARGSRLSLPNNDWATVLLWKLSLRGQQTQKFNCRRQTARRSFEKSTDYCTTLKNIVHDLEI